MKKFFIFIVILFFIGGAVFYIGWLQLNVDRNEIGVVHTKTVGYLNKPVQSGTFFWTGWKLIPRNVTLVTIPDAPQQLEISLDGMLPSGDIYSHFLPASPDFSYTMDINLSVRLNEEHVVELVSSDAVSSENFNAWIHMKKQEITQLLNTLYLEEIVQHTSDDTAGGSLLPDAEDLAGLLMTELNNSFKYLTAERVSITRLIMPDIELYNQAKKNYRSMLSKQQSSLDRAMQDLADMRAEEELTLQKLENYGELFTKYPVLLELMKTSGFDSLP